MNYATKLSAEFDWSTMAHEQYTRLPTGFLFRHPT